MEALGPMFNQIKLAYTLSRYFNTPERLTNLLTKISNQIIVNCKQFIRGETQSIWDEDPEVLLDSLEVCINLNDAYQDIYRVTKEKLQAQAKSRSFDLNELAIFGKMEHFVQRLERISEMIITQQQFKSLTDIRVEGLDEAVMSFFEVGKAIQRKSYDFLDFQKSLFDHDFNDFRLAISNFEDSLQEFLDESFEKITDTDQALALLEKFRSVLTRQSLKENLDSKYMVIFRNYGQDLEQIQQIYESQKKNPPLIRDAPAVAGNIAWSRHLLHRVEHPMQQFQLNQTIMESAESKKIIKLYNRLSTGLIAFETLWHMAWNESIETARHGLHATLIVRHQDSGAMYVNFDRAILQLIRETKWLLRLDIKVPDTASSILLQEEKFKHYNDQLEHVIQEYERVTGMILPVVRDIVTHIVRDLDAKIRPGITNLTWTSMNIEVYLHNILTGIQSFEHLINKVEEIIEGRVERNLKYISRALLVDLTEDKSYTLDSFVGAQGNHVVQQALVLDSKNMEAENAIEEVFLAIEHFALEHEELDFEQFEKQKTKIREHYQRLLKNAVLNCIKNSMHALKKRLGSRQQTGFLFVDRPLFDVDVELTIPEVSLNPSLEELQDAINSVAKSVIQSSSQIFLWGTDRGLRMQRAQIQKSHANSMLPPQDEEEALQIVQEHTLYPQISKDMNIVRYVLLLAGGIQGIKTEVANYLSRFSDYDYLWKENMQIVYSQFMKSNPALEDFKAEMTRYLNVEQEIAKIPRVHNIGALSLETQSLKYSLKSAAAGWKQQFARNLHQQASTDLYNIFAFMREMTAKLKRDINDLDDLRDILANLALIRERESEIDLEFSPVEEKFDLLMNYEVRLNKEESLMVGQLRHEWAALRQLSVDTTEHLSKMQVQFKRELIRNIKNFVVDVISFKNDYDANGPSPPDLNPNEAVSRLEKYAKLFMEREAKWKQYQAGEELFGLQRTEYPELVKVKQDLKKLTQLYTLYETVRLDLDQYRKYYWGQVDLDLMISKLKEFSKKCRGLPKSNREYKAYKIIRENITEFEELIPLLQRLSHKSLRPRHWLMIAQVTEGQLRLADNATLEDVLNSNVLTYREDIEEIANAAVKELDIETKLKIIEEDWADQNFTFGTFNNRGPVVLKGQETQEIIDLLDESSMTLSAVTSSRYVDAFREEVVDWLAKLQTVGDIIEQWQDVQNRWTYLEAVFSSPSIAKQLPHEAKRFALIDQKFIKIMTKAYEIRNVIQCCYSNDMLRTLLPHLREQLELCQRSLTGYLEKKRSIFPRFYFVSDPVLLQLLSQSSEPQAITTHLPTIFGNVSDAKFDEIAIHRIQQLVSNEGEALPLTTPIDATGNIEVWLGNVVTEMQSTLKDIIRDASGQYNKMEFLEFVDRYVSQVGIVGLQMLWTEAVEDALEKGQEERGALHVASQKFNQLLSEFTDKGAQGLKGNERTRNETLITIQVHQRDVFDDLVSKKGVFAKRFRLAKTMPAVLERIGRRVDGPHCRESIQLHVRVPGLYITSGGHPADRSLLPDTVFRVGIALRRSTVRTRGNGKDRDCQGSGSHDGQVRRGVQRRQADGLPVPGSAVQRNGSERRMDMFRRSESYFPADPVCDGRTGELHSQGVATTPTGHHVYNRRTHSSGTRLRYVHHDEPRIRRSPRAARESQGAVPQHEHDGARSPDDHDGETVCTGIPGSAYACQKVFCALQDVLAAAVETASLRFRIA
eukprot:TRINITY_DN1008_c0_g3_i1.p1 TRINITY_DN1008_c0_g3~~TRINITY_DN1008_c0_g3_i1.p1  ORF type:complete len:1912 (+),score=670.21 TRINITY_DN1008_c0_g3_i1:589-5736(+)